MFVSTSKILLLVETQVKLSVLAETNTEKIFTCGNQVKFVWLNKKKYFLLIGIITKDIILAVETKQIKYFFCSRNGILFFSWVNNYR